MVIYINAKTVCVYFWLLESGKDKERQKWGMMLKEKNGQSNKKKMPMLSIIPSISGPLRAQQGDPTSPPKTSDLHQLESKVRALELDVLRRGDGVPDGK